MKKTNLETSKNLKIRTKMIHAGRHPADHHGFVNTPIYRGSTVLAPNYQALFDHSMPYTYGRFGTPTTQALETAWSDLAGAAGTVLAPSGLAAISLALMSVLSAGDHILVTDSAYRPTRAFCDRYLRRMGVETTYFDPMLGANVTDQVKPNTRAIMLESPGSQSFEMQDIPAIAAAVKPNDICVIMDNTWATPFFFSPHAHGVDLAIESGTKYLSGHSDLLLGLVSANARYLPKLRETFETIGMTPGPEDVYLALRGLRTMELRLREAEKQALALAHWLAERPEVVEVLHPALPSHPGHAIWQRDFLGSSGLFSIILQPAPEAAVAAMLDELKLFGMGYSWGGFESLIIPFDCGSYRTATKWNPKGPSLRLQVGLEDIEDLKEDLDRGFAKFNALRS
jgi:cystathionine beta-lyase